MLGGSVTPGRVSIRKRSPVRHGRSITRVGERRGLPRLSASGFGGWSGPVRSGRPLPVLPLASLAAARAASHVTATSRARCHPVGRMVPMVETAPPDRALVGDLRALRGQWQVGLRVPLGEQLRPQRGNRVRGVGAGGVAVAAARLADRAPVDRRAPGVARGAAPVRNLADPGADRHLVDRVEVVGPLGVDVGEVGRPSGRRP